MSVAIIGGGTFGTAVAAAIAASGREVLLLVRDAALAESINRERCNARYLPEFRLPRSLRASTQGAALRDAPTVFLAVPGHSVERTCEGLRHDLSPRVQVVNLAKGLHPDVLTINRAIQRVLPEALVCALKGPTFARPMIQGATSGMTLACPDADAARALSALFADSRVRLDHWPRVEEVEFASALKNVLAVAMGICDAIDDNPNTRFLVMQRVINEANGLLRHFGFDPGVLFTFAGLGDLLMTALNDTSRNRTLGLLIGRGFDLAVNDNGPVLEGRRSVQLIHRRLRSGGAARGLIEALDDVFEHRIGPQAFFNEMTRAT